MRSVLFLLTFTSRVIFLGVIFSRLGLFSLIFTLLRISDRVGPRFERSKSLIDLVKTSIIRCLCHCFHFLLRNRGQFLRAETEQDHLQVMFHMDDLGCMSENSPALQFAPNFEGAREPIDEENYRHIIRSLTQHGNARRIQRITGRTQNRQDTPQKRRELQFEGLIRSRILVPLMDCKEYPRPNRSRQRCPRIQLDGRIVTECNRDDKSGSRFRLSTKFFMDRSHQLGTT